MGKIKHGEAHSRLHWVWIGMNQRCENPKHISYKNYGARGIKVCIGWKEFIKFRDWSLANGYIVEANYRQTIDRIDGNDNYKPSNCRWVGQKKQMNNTRVNHKLTAFGETKTMMEWSEDSRCKVSYFTLRNRVSRDNWSSEEAIDTPSLGIGNVRDRKAYNKGVSQVAHTVFTAFGETKALVQWLDDPRCVVPYSTLHNRVVRRGWEPEKALVTKKIR